MAVRVYSFNPLLEFRTIEALKQAAAQMQQMQQQTDQMAGGGEAIQRV